jgi:MFS family permease
MENSSHGRRSLIVLSVVGLLASLQVGFTTFIDSSYLSHALSRFTAQPDRFVGYIFAATAGLALFYFLMAPKLMRRFGNTAVALFAAITLPLGLFLIASPIPLPLTILTYLLITLDTTMLFAALDVYISQYVSEAKMGILHGVFFAVCSLGFMLSPAFSGYIAAGYAMHFVYVAAAISALPIPFIIWFALRDFVDPTYDDVPLLIGKELHDAAPDLLPVFAAQFALQTFYVMMTIYIPLYFVEHIGFTYDEFGFVITIALAMFVILPTPYGWLADKFIGEKEMIITGMVIMGISLIVIPLFAEQQQSFALWATLLIISRIGATATESMSDTFFFKRIEYAHPSLIAFYRRARPLAWLIVPTIAATLLSLQVIGISRLLMFSGVAIIFAIALVARLRDTL